MVLVSSPKGALGEAIDSTPKGARTPDDFYRRLEDFCRKPRNCQISLKMTFLDVSDDFPKKNNLWVKILHLENFSKKKIPQKTHQK